MNILDKKNWDLFGIYAAVVWSLTLFMMPGLLYLLSLLGKRLSKADHPGRDLFLKYSASLLPLGLLLWMAFVIPMLFTNLTFVLQSLSDPFGWGWDFFGTANTPWHPFLPRFIPWIQAILILIGFYLSLRNMGRSIREMGLKAGRELMAMLPYAAFLLVVVTGLLFFFTN